jgi:putative transposon-encoded protein
MVLQKKDVIPMEQSPKGEKKFKPFQAKFEVFGEEMIEKEVKQSGNSGRVYLPPEWVGKQVKIIRIN